MEKELEIVTSCLHPVIYDDAIPDSLYNAVKGSLKEQLNYMILLLVDYKRNDSSSDYIVRELKRVSKEIAMFMEGKYSTDMSHNEVNEQDVYFAFEKLHENLANGSVQREAFNEFKAKYPFSPDIQKIPYEDIREPLSRYIHLKEKQIYGQFSLFDYDMMEKVQNIDKSFISFKQSKKLIKQINFDTGVVFSMKESFEQGYFHGSDLTECPFLGNSMHTPWGNVELVVILDKNDPRKYLNMDDKYVFSVDYDCPMDEDANYTLFFEVDSLDEYLKCQDIAEKIMCESGRMFTQKEIIEEISETCGARFLHAVNETDVINFLNDIEKTNSLQPIRKGKAR